MKQLKEKGGIKMGLINRQIEVDTHTHTILSGHAWSTLSENINAAVQVGLKAICMTEHGPAMAGTFPEFAPFSFKMIPDELHGVRIFKGVEFNIRDRAGTIDIIDEQCLACVQFGIASMHDVTMPCTAIKDHTDGYIGALQNKHIDILGHPGYAYFSHDAEAIVKAAAQVGKMIEINNNSFASRAGSRENCVLFARLCKQYDVRVCVSSDAHFYTMVGKVPLAMQMLEEVAFPPELILNLSSDGFLRYLSDERRARLKNE